MSIRRVTAAICLVAALAVGAGACGSADNGGVMETNTTEG